MKMHFVAMAIGGVRMSDDLISRQTLRIDMYHEVFEKGSDEQRWDSGCWIRYKMFERVVDRQPSAQPERCEDCGNFNKTRLVIPQPERKKGKWIYYPKASGSVESTAVHLYPVCSECGHEHPIANFCPNCGAKMEVEE